MGKFWPNVLFALLTLMTIGCNAILGYEMNHDADAGADSDTDSDADTDTDTDNGTTYNCPTDICNEEGTAWLDYPERCEATDDDCKCEPTETACKVSLENECCDASCSSTEGCVTTVGECVGSIDSCTDHILHIGKVCEGCGENGAKGVCGPGKSFECSDSSYTNCESVSCGGGLYYCLDVAGIRKWTSSDLCNKDVKDGCIPPVCGTCEDADAMECTSGDCCDSNCRFYKASDNHTCEEVVEYDCEGASSMCGANALERKGTKTCTGDSSDCTDMTIDWGNSWTDLEICGPNDICEIKGGVSKCTACTQGCNAVSGTCNEECNPSTSTCCDDDGKWKLNKVEQPGDFREWIKCPLGQTWVTGSSCHCTGTSSQLTYTEALTACPAGYHLPTRQELMDMLEGCDYDALAELSTGKCNTCQNSSDCTAMFGTDEGVYWSSTNYGSSNAWFFDFYGGVVTYRSQSNLYDVRCIND